MAKSLSLFQFLVITSAMARWRAVSNSLAGLLLAVVGAAYPATETQAQHSTSAASVTNSTSAALRHIVARVTQDNDNDDNGSRFPGFTGASAIAVSVSAVLVLAVALSLAYSVYYRHAKLRLQKKALARLGPLPPLVEGQQPLRPIAPWRTTTGVAPDGYGLALLMASTARLSPAVYSALHEEAQRSLAVPVESKTRGAVPEDKVLGRREDMFLVRQQTEVGAQLFAAPRIALR